MSLSYLLHFGLGESVPRKTRITTIYFGTKQKQNPNCFIKHIYPSLGARKYIGSTMKQLMDKMILDNCLHCR